MGQTHSTHARNEEYVQNCSQKTEEKTPLGRPWARWEDNTKMELTETGCEGVEQILLAQEESNGRFCEHDNEPSGYNKQ